MTNTFILSLATIFSYLVAAFSQRLSRQASSKAPLLVLGIVAISLHAWVLYLDTITHHGFNFSFFHAASLIAWVVGLLLLLTLPRQPVENLILAWFPLAAFVIGLEEYFHTERLLSFHQGVGVTTHIFSSVLAYSLLSISALQAIFLAIQDYSLHRKHPGWVTQKLPPLRVMENLLFQSIAVGFLFLSMSLISGIVFLEDIFAQHLVHKTALSILAWCVFAVLLWGHWRYGWRGRTAIRWNLSGFFVLMLAYFGSKLVLELILKR